MRANTAGSRVRSGGRLRAGLKGKAPSLRYERELWGSGNCVVVGIDEVGRGSWAGPLTVGAVIIPQGRRIYKVRESKMLKVDEREELYDRLVDWVDGFSVGHVSASECDELGMSKAQRLAAHRALEGLGSEIDHVLIDGSWDFVSSETGRDSFDVTMIVKGDRYCLSIAAASVIAKVTRDRLMVEMAKQFPQYHFASNKGYPCPRHRAALDQYGPCEQHRHSWSFIDGLPDSGIELRTKAQRLF